MWEDFKKNRVLQVFRHFDHNRAVWIKRMGTKFGETCDLKAMQVSKNLVVIFSDKSQYVEQMMLPENLYSHKVSDIDVRTAEEIEVKILETKSKMDNGKSQQKNEQIGECQLFRLTSETVLVVPNLRINPNVKIFDVIKREWSNIFSIKCWPNNTEFISSVFKDNTFLFGQDSSSFKLLGGNRDR